MKSLKITSLRTVDVCTICDCPRYNVLKQLLQLLNHILQEPWEPELTFCATIKVGVVYLQTENEWLLLPLPGSIDLHTWKSSPAILINAHPWLHRYPYTWIHLHTWKSSPAILRDSTLTRLSWVAIHWHAFSHTPCFSFLCACVCVCVCVCGVQWS